MPAVNVEPQTPPAHSHIHLLDVEDAAPANGFGAHWEARVARTALGAQQTGVTHFRLRFGAGPDGLEFLALGPHHEADGEPVTDVWTS